MAFQEFSVRRSPVLLAGLALVIAAVLAGGIFYGFHWRAKMRAQAQKGEARSAWVSQALDACEAEAGKHPEGLYFMVVPLAPARPGSAGGARSRALETVGPVVLLESKVALDGLESGTLRISREQFILYAMDSQTNAIHRWNSATGVSTLSEASATSKGPFKVRLQTAPIENAQLQSQWSVSLAEGLATCHWVFALLRN